MIFVNFDSFDTFPESPTVSGIKNTVLSLIRGQKHPFCHKSVFITVFINPVLRWTGFRARCCFQKEPGGQAIDVNPCSRYSMVGCPGSGRWWGGARVMGTVAWYGPWGGTVVLLRVHYCTVRVPKSARNPSFFIKFIDFHQKREISSQLGHKRIKKGSKKGQKFTKIHWKTLKYSYSQTP